MAGVSPLQVPTRLFGDPIYSTHRSIAEHASVPRKARGRDRTATPQATVHRTDELRAQAWETVRLAHAAVDALDPTAIVNHGRALSSILWRLAGLGVVLRPGDLSETTEISTHRDPRLDREVVLGGRGRHPDRSHQPRSCSTQHDWRIDVWTRTEPNDGRVVVTWCERSIRRCGASDGAG